MIRPRLAAARHSFLVFFPLATLTHLACANDGELDDIDVETVRAGLLQQFDLRPLSTEPVLQPTNGNIIDQAAAIRLGKSFFWDMQTGSDGQTGCATCHHSFGVDGRVFNTIEPGLNGIYEEVSGPGQTFTPRLITSDDIRGSQGVPRANFVSIPSDPTTAAETCTPINHALFGFERQVEFRSAPTIFGAAFMRQLFWAGEANQQFNGLTIWGFTGNSLATCPPNIACTNMDNAALASQAVGPIGNNTEMRCVGRPSNSALGLAGKLLARQPLQFQRVSQTDSVLGALAHPTAPGLWCNGVPCRYRDMIAAAFGPTLAAAAEPNFTLIWGQAIQAYESTLIPDQTPFDRFLAGDHSALTKNQLAGLIRFAGTGKCANCHAGPMLSDATYSYFASNGPLNRDGGDQGFHNIGLRPSEEDFARGDFGPGGVPLSVSNSDFDLGAFKTPTLRNVKLTGPYFHNGAFPSLLEVVEFYDRGGDFPGPSVSADVTTLGLAPYERRAIVDFMENALTDCRVEKQRAPFDHPEIFVANGPHVPAVGAEGTGPCN